MPDEVVITTTFGTSQWTHTTTDRQLHTLQQSPFPPFTLQPFNWNLRSLMFRVAATTALADGDLSDHESLRF